MRRMKLIVLLVMVLLMIGKISIQNGKMNVSCKLHSAPGVCSYGYVPSSPLRNVTTRNETEKNYVYINLNAGINKAFPRTTIIIQYYTIQSTITLHFADFIYPSAFVADAECSLIMVYIACSRLVVLLLTKDKAKFHEIFEQYGLVYGVQVFPGQIRKSDTAGKESGTTGGGYYAFVTFYSVTAAARAKEDLNSVLLLDDNECKIAFARRKKDATEKQVLHFTRCYELTNYYLGFNSWSTTIKTLFEDKESLSETEQTKTVKFVCLVELSVRDLKTDGIGVWEETFQKTDPLSKIKAVCKCKKLCQQRAVENAFSKVLLIVLPNGKVTVEIDTTKPDFNTANYVPDDQLIKVNDLDTEPASENIPEGVEGADMSNLSAMDDVNIHILQELEDDF